MLLHLVSIYSTEKKLLCRLCSPGLAQCPAQMLCQGSPWTHTQSLQQLSSSWEILVTAALKMQHGYEVNTCFWIGFCGVHLSFDAFLVVRVVDTLLLPVMDVAHVALLHLSSMGSGREVREGSLGLSGIGGRNWKSEAVVWILNLAPHVMNLSLWWSLVYLQCDFGAEDTWRSLPSSQSSTEHQWCLCFCSSQALQETEDGSILMGSESFYFLSPVFCGLGLLLVGWFVGFVQVELPFCSHCVWHFVIIFPHLELH